MATPVQQAEFLRVLAETGVAASAARASGLHYGSCFKLRETDADFAAAWAEALETATDALEQEARRRALQGHDEPVIYQGQPTPLWARDADGRVILDEYTYESPPDKDGKVTKLKGSRPRQLVIDGVPQVLTIKKHSDALLQFLLKGNRAKFKDSSKLELSNPDGTLAPLDETTKAARLATLIALAASRAKGDAFDDLA